MSESEELRALPAVHEVAGRIAAPGIPHHLLVAEIRRVLDDARRDIRNGTANGASEVAIETRVERALRALESTSLRRVINATGVILHTNLGRAPLGPLAVLAGYTNLEYDLATGLRGKRDAHTAGLIERLLGAPGIAVNNNAAAFYLALNEIAAGHQVVVSRGELIEIGDGFRIPDIMQRSGALLSEVGTTNRTTIADYRDAITGDTRLLLRVHPSNFRIEGFTARVSLEELVALGRERGIPVYEDLGSGCLVDLRPFGIDEPLASDSLRAGADLISFSGDKLLGGPQAGLLAGKPEIVARLRRNPMFRALRLDKMIYQALETTLRHLLLERWEQVPALRMIRQTPDEIRQRAERMLCSIAAAELTPGESVIGGGATPEQSIPTWLISIACADENAAQQKLRANDPPVIARVEEKRLLVDLRTVLPDEEAELAAALQALS